MSTFPSDSHQLLKGASQSEGEVNEDDEIWIKYLEIAEASDKRMINDWTRVVDSILVFVGFFL